MVERIKTYRVPSPDIQGEGSWVEFDYLTFKDSAERPDTETDEETIAEALSFLRSHISDWNWVDDDGKPLDRDIDFDDLLMRERDFLLSGLFNQNRGEEKN